MQWRAARFLGRQRDVPPDLPEAGVSLASRVRMLGWRRVERAVKRQGPMPWPPALRHAPAAGVSCMRTRTVRHTSKHGRCTGATTTTAAPAPQLDCSHHGSLSKGLCPSSFIIVPTSGRSHLPALRYMSKGLCPSSYLLGGCVRGWFRVAESHETVSHPTPPPR